MKKIIAVIFLLCFLVISLGCASTGNEQQAKIFDMTCPDTGCNFKNFTYYAPISPKEHVVLSVVKTVFPILGQVYLGVNQSRDNRLIHTSTMGTFGSIFNKAGGNISISDSGNDSSSYGNSWDNSTKTSTETNTSDSNNMSTDSSNHTTQ